MSDFQYVPLDECRRVRALRAPRATVARLVGALGRINTLYMIARAGSGHIGTSFSSIDLVTWLHLYELRSGDDPASPLDVYFSSKGHDVPAFYATMIALGRLPFDLLHRLRRLHGLPGHPDVATPGVFMNTGSLGMGISKAKGIALANRRLGLDGRVYVLTGDGELQEGQNWEALQQAANLGLAEITAIVDRNRIQSDTWVRAVSDCGDLGAKFAAFGWHVVDCDGHDPESIGRSLEAARAERARPTVIVAETVKGKGVSFMEGPAMPPDDQMYHFHSGAPSAEQYGRAVEELVSAANRQLEAAGAAPLRTAIVPREPARPSSGTQHLVKNAYAPALVRAAGRHPRLVVLDADLVLDCGLVPFRDRFPDRFIECGIAEQDMVSVAGGLASRGLLPVAHSFTCFLSSRPNEQIYNNATERRKVIYVGSLAGLLPGGPGHSHQCVRDISSLGGVPHLAMIEPSCEAEVALAVDYCVDEAPESCFLRLVSITVQVPYDLPAGYRLQEGRGVAIRGGRDAVAIGYGPIMLTQAVKAADRLEREHGISLRVVNLPWLNRLDPAWLREAVQDVRTVFTLDNHYLAGGQGQMLLAAMAEQGLAEGRTVRRFGVERIPESGGNDEVLQAHRLDAASLAEAMARHMLAPAGQRPGA
jgi:transketolase